MLELQVPLLAAKALLLLLLFAFVYAVVRRGIGDLRSIPDENDVSASGGAASGGAAQRQQKPRHVSELHVEESEVLEGGSTYSLTGESTSVGRSSEGDIVIQGDDYTSGRHARFTRHGGLLYVEDLGSTNGTFVNGNKAVGATPLRDGDEIKVGSTIFRFVE